MVNDGVEMMSEYSEECYTCGQEFSNEVRFELNGECMKCKKMICGHCSVPFGDGIKCKVECGPFKYKHEVEVANICIEKNELLKLSEDIASQLDRGFEIKSVNVYEPIPLLNYGLFIMVKKTKVYCDEE